MTWCKWRSPLSALSLECLQYILSDIDQCIIRILVITLHLCPYIFGILFQLIIMFCRNLSKIFLFIQHREIYFICEHVYGHVYSSYDAKAVKMKAHATLSQNTNYPLQFDRPHEAAAMKQYRKSKIVILPLAVSLKNLPLYLSALYEIYIPAHIYRCDTLASFPLISVHNTFARVVDSTGRRWMNRPCT